MTNEFLILNMPNFYHKPLRSKICGRKKYGIIKGRGKLNKNLVNFTLFYLMTLSVVQIYILMINC